MFFFSFCFQEVECLYIKKKDSKKKHNQIIRKFTENKIYGNQTFSGSTMLSPMEIKLFLGQRCFHPQGACNGLEKIRFNFYQTKF